jgi:citrate lyase beta subunit
MAVCEFAKMQAFGWNDNNLVHILSTADSSQERNNVWLQGGAAKLQIPCPRAIPMYNDVIQGVDRHDQLRSKFALASRHGFKKYYVTHQSGQVDI